MSHPCEKCGAAKAQRFHAFEIESWGQLKEDEKKEIYYLCLSCFDRMTEAPLHTKEVEERLKENRKQLVKLIEEGKVCPECKTIIIEVPHTCPDF